MNKLPKEIQALLDDMEAEDDAKKVIGKTAQPAGERKIGVGETMKKADPPPLVDPRVPPTEAKHDTPPENTGGSKTKKKDTTRTSLLSQFQGADRQLRVGAGFKKFMSPNSLAAKMRM
jgi:hypothetical protein